jgi:hypothetical protein
MAGLARESVVMAAGGWRTRSMFDRYAIVSTKERTVAAQRLDEADHRLPLFPSPAEIEPEANARAFSRSSKLLAI